MTNLVTVTCARDLNQMVLQAHSINKFVSDPITHYVFIEDNKLSLTDWENLLSPHYLKHRLELIKAPNPANLNGWYNQQIIKLRAVEYVNDDYILLDSKNFFIKPTDLKYNLPEGNWFLLKNTEWTDPFIKFLREHYNVHTPEFYYTQHTPFKIRKDIVLNVLKLFDVESMFQISAEKRVYPSEFVLYTIASDLRPNYELWCEYSCNPKYHTWWWSDDVRPEQFEDIYNSTVEILGIHKNVWFDENNHLTELARWLVSKGLDKKYVYPATINMDWGDTYLQDRPITNPLVDE